MQHSLNSSRRATLKAFAAGAGALLAHSPALAAQSASAPAPGRLRQSVCRWPYANTQLTQLCRRAKELGFVGIDLLYPDEWPLAADTGLLVTMGYASRRPRLIEQGFNDPALQDGLVEELLKALPKAAQCGVANLIAMFGNRLPGMNEEQAKAHCIAGLSRVAPAAERHGVTVCVELLNSKVDHPGYQGDHTAFGAAVIRGVNSPRVKLLYDIYHMQIMEGDVIRTLRTHIGLIGHFHTGGVPGRHEIDDTQELNYHAIAAAIADAGYRGFVAHEFVPTKPDPFESLAQAFRVCTV